MFFSLLFPLFHHVRAQKLVHFGVLVHQFAVCCFHDQNAVVDGFQHAHHLLGLHLVDRGKQVQSVELGESPAKKVHKKHHYGAQQHDDHPELVELVELVALKMHPHEIRDEKQSTDHELGLVVHQHERPYDHHVRHRQIVDRQKQRVVGDVGIW